MEATGQLRTIRFHAIAAAVTWTAAVLLSFVFYARLAHAGVVALAAAQARAEFRKDVAYRRWVAERGGVYVPVSAATPPNPYLHADERDVLTSAGRALTLVNPAYLTRQVFEAERTRGGLEARITAAAPLRPENAPDDWEAAALAKLAEGAPEVVDELTPAAGVLRYMGRLETEERCVGCHPGSRPGDLRGGISISVPMAEYFAVSDAQIEGGGIAHLVVWALGLVAVAFADGRAARRLRERARELGARAGLEQELAHARRLEGLGRLAGGVAHDLNNLLSPILGNAALALERAPEPELRQDLEEIREAAQRARLLTQQLLAFGRKQVLSLEPLDPSEAVDGIVPMVRRLVGEGVAVRMELERGLPAVRVDRGQLGAALLNLAANARDAMPDGGVLRIATAPAELDGARAARHGVVPGRYVAITVSDTGHGMDDATRARLFEPFFTTKTTGNGLGLASAHGTVRQLGGTIEVDSAPGAGAVFRVLLPASAEAALATPKPVLDGAVPRGTEVVLVAEDDLAVRRYVAAVLSGLGYRVLAAASGDEALAAEQTHEGEIHALVSDLRMPGMGGLELRRRLAVRRPGIATVYITGYAGDTLGPVHTLPEGTVVVHKPFTPADLGAAVRGVLDARPPQPGSAASRSWADSHSA